MLNFITLPTQVNGIRWTSHEPGTLARLYPMEFLHSWDSIQFAEHGCYFENNGVRVLRSTVQRLFGDYATDPENLLHSYMTIPNGQVKNFLVACRTTNYYRDTWRIVVVGSKSNERGGIWHKLYAYWMSRYCKSLVIDFYDPNEMDSEWSTELNGCQISCQWWASYAPELQGYDAVISDVWTLRDGVEYNVPEVEAYSLKGVKGEVAYQPFLHPRETRFFSTKARQEVTNGCRCMTCQVSKDCSETYSDYKVLRDLCARLGHEPVCAGMSSPHDLLDVSKLQRIMMAGAEENLTTRNSRSATSLTEEIGIQVTDKAQLIRRGDSSFRIIGRYNRTYWVNPDDVVPELEGENIQFIGVHPEVVGRTRLRNVGETTVTFLRTVESWMTSLVSSRVYAPISSTKVSLYFPGWSATGRAVGVYNEYRRDSPKRYEVTDLHPNVLSPESIVDRYPVSQGVYYSLKISQGACELVSYQESLPSIRLHNGRWDYAHMPYPKCVVHSVGPYNSLRRCHGRLFDFYFKHRHKSYENGYDFFVREVRGVGSGNGVRVVNIDGQAYTCGPDEVSFLALLYRDEFKKCYFMFPEGKDIFSKGGMSLTTVSGHL